MEIKYDANGLVPAIAQDVNTGEVLMLAYMNEQALRQTLETRLATYYSRSRRELWVKGGTSGNLQKVAELHYDCDADALLLLVEQTGPACHTGERTCFHNPLLDGTGVKSAVVAEVFAVIRDRMLHPKDDSYTNYLLGKGVDKICKKVGEEASEVIIAAKNRDAGELSGEMADLVYHMLVLMAEQGITPEDVYEKLRSRR